MIKHTSAIFNKLHISSAHPTNFKSRQTLHEGTISKQNKQLRREVVELLVNPILSMKHLGV